MPPKLDVLVETDAFVALHQPDHRLVSVFFLGPPNEDDIAGLSRVMKSADERSDAVLVYIHKNLETPPREVRDGLSEALAVLSGSVPGLVCVVPGTGLGSTVKRTMSSVIMSLSGLKAPATVVGDADAAGKWLAKRLGDSFDHAMMTDAVEQGVLAVMGS